MSKEGSKAIKQSLIKSRRKSDSRQLVNMPPITQRRTRPVWIQDITSCEECLEGKCPQYIRHTKEILTALLKIVTKSALQTRNFQNLPAVLRSIARRSISPLGQQHFQQVRQMLLNRVPRDDIYRYIMVSTNQPRAPAEPEATESEEHQQITNI